METILTNIKYHILIYPKSKAERVFLFPRRAEQQPNYDKVSRQESTYYFVILVGFRLMQDFVSLYPQWWCKLIVP